MTSWKDNVYAVAAQGHTVLNQGLYEESATQMYELGHILRLNDGRTFKYALAGATALVAGNLLMADASVRDAAAYDDIAVATTAVGSTSVVITTNGSGGLDENELAGGWLIIHDGGTTYGQGIMYKVKGHAAIAASTAGTIYLHDPIAVALTNGTSVAMVIPPLEYKVVQCAVTSDIADSTPVGVAPRAVTANYYFWMQTYGPACVLQGSDASTATDPGVPCRPGDDAGSVEPNDISSDIDSMNVGYYMTALGADTDNAPIFLTIAA